MYTALYRQWRPDTFEDVVGQDTIVRTLKNQLHSGRIAHAYLFCGSRGTGKTSTAKIFSRAINCMTPVENGPCGTCDACINLASGNNMDIMEIDAASNNGVDEIRDLRDKVRFPPTVGKYKVYIIDEVHMLSMGAFNALLKTLEEPPEHVVFILATTEPHKLPATILSRCQRYDFKRIPIVVIVDRMKTICEKMNITVEEAGLYTIARWAEGGMRDALSLLDQSIGFCGDKISNKDILSVLGTADQGFIFHTVDDILLSNAQQLLNSIGLLMDDGKDLNVFLRDILHHLRNLLVIKYCDDPAKLLDVEESTIVRLKAQAQNAGEARLIRSIETLSALEAKLKWSTQSRVLFELAVVKLCRPEQEDSMEALLDRIELLEKQVKGGVIEKLSSVVNKNDDLLNQPKFSARDMVNNKIINDTNQVYEKVLDEKPIIKEKAATIEKVTPIEKAAPSTPRNPVEAWSDILKLIKKERLPIYTLLGEAKPRLEGNNILILMFPQEQGFFVAAIEKEGNRVFIEGLILRVAGQQFRVKCQLGNQIDKQAAIDDDYVVRKAIEVFGEELVEVIEEK